MARKGENIYKRKDGRWEARYIHHYENGKAKYKSIYGASYAEAKAKKLEELAKPENMRVSAVKQTANLEEICTLWLNNRKTRVKESTYTRYVRIVKKHILPGFEIFRVLKIGNDTVNLFFEKLKTELSVKTVLDIKCVFLSIWKYGKENGYPCCELRLAKEKVKNIDNTSVLPAETLNRIQSLAIKQNDIVSFGILFTLFTGVRIGELCGLKWGDIDFENECVYIRRTVERIANLDENAQSKTKVIISEPKTEYSVRTIPLPSCIRDYIKSFQQTDEKYILTGTVNHTEPHTYYMRYKNFLRKNHFAIILFMSCGIHLLHSVSIKVSTLNPCLRFSDIPM